MEKICPESGFVHILFANEDDTYFTEHPVALSFEKYMTYLLKKQQTKKIENVYFINKHCRIMFGDRESRDRYDKAGGIIQVEAMQDSLKRLSRLVKKGNTAIVISADAVFTILNDPKRAKLLGSLRDPTHSSLFIVTFPVDADHFVELISPNNGQTGVLNAPQLEFVRGIDYNVEAMYTFPLEEMLNLDTTKKRIVFFNDLSYSDILNITKYYFFKNVSPGSPDYELIDWFAAVIYAWHNSILFRGCCDIGFLENPFRKMSVIEKSLSKPVVFSSIRGIAAKLRDEYSEHKKNAITDHSVGGSNVDYFLCKLDLDNSENVKNVYSHSEGSHIGTIRSIIKTAYSCFGMSAENFDPETFAVFSANLAPFAEAEREMKKILVKSNPNHNAEDSFNRCLVEISGAFRNFKNNDEIVCMLTERNGLYADLFFKTVRKYNETVMMYRFNDDAENITYVSAGLKYCDIATAALKILKTVGRNSSAGEDNKNKELRDKLTDVCRTLDNVTSAGGIIAFHTSLVSFLNDKYIT